MRRRFIQIILIVSIVFAYGNALSCDKIAMLPPEFDILLPNHNKLKRAHISNNFFLDEPNQGTELNFHLKLEKKSVVKIQVTPHHATVSFSVSTSTSNSNFTASSGVPVDFTSIDNFLTGDINIHFYDFVQSQDTLRQEIISSTIKETECKSPYMRFEVYYETEENYKKRLLDISKNVKNLKNFNDDFWGVFKDIEKAEVKTKGKDLLVQKIKRDITPYKLSTKHLQFYDRFNISILSEFDLNIPEDTSSENIGDRKISTRVFVKMQIYGEFLLCGGIHMLIIKKDAINDLKEYDCIGNGRCIISQRKSKNGMVFESVVTPGEYKILIANMNLDKMNLFNLLKTNFIPISAGIKIKNMKSNDNRFNCNGKRLPVTFNHLFNLNKHYFEYKGKIMFNTKDLYDDVYFKIPSEDYFLRVNTYFSDGNSINIKLYEIDSAELNKMLTENVTNFLDEINKSTNIRTLSSESSFWGGTSALYSPLNKDKIYMLHFDYTGSLFTQYDRKSCELFYMKLAIGSESHIKTNFPKAFSSSDKCKLNSNGLDTFIDNFAKGHTLKDNYVNKVYSSTSEEFNAINDLSSLEDFRVIYSRDLQIKADINIYIEVMSDFLTSSVIPIIFPSSMKKNKDFIKTLTPKDFKKMMLHKGNINMKLNKGSYILVLIHGLTQFTESTEKDIGLLAKDLYLPECVSFKLRINSILLNTKTLLKWECNYYRFHHIPDLLELTKLNEKYYYFNHHMLIPISKSVMKIKTGNEKYLLRLRVQYPREDDENYMNIYLKRNNKIIKRAKREIFEEGSDSDISYINYILFAESDYELEFVNDEKSFTEFFDTCKMFTLDLLITKVDSGGYSQCQKKIPTTKQIIYERTIDEDNSYQEYKELILFNAFSFFNGRFSDKKPSKDLEKNPNNSVFKFPFKADSNMLYEYPFKILSSQSRVTLLIETPYALPFEISARLYSKTQSNVVELIGTEDIEDENILSMRGVLLTKGSYKVVIGVNTKMYDEKVRSSLNDFCVEFTASLIIENKSYEFGLRTARAKNENCPYIEFPNQLNIPGWLSFDTSYSINLMQRFKIKNDKMVKRFTITKTSLFKFYLPDKNIIYKSIVLNFEKNNRQSQMIRTIKNNENYIVSSLEPGNYALEFIFDLDNQKTMFIFRDENQFEHLCYFFNVYIAIQPSADILPSTINCDTTSLKSLELKPSSTELYKQIFIDNSNYDYMSQMKSIKRIKVNPDNTGKSKIMFEFIYNTYIDSLYSFKTYQIKGSSRTPVPYELIVEGNFIWIMFSTEKSKEYEIDFLSAPYSFYGECSTAFISYSYVNTLSDNSTNVNENSGSKSNCPIKNTLPSRLFDINDSTLKLYGGGQSKINGEMYFLGRFSLPRSTKSLRTQFLIKKESIIIIQLKPLYKRNVNNEYLEISKDEFKVTSTMKNRNSFIIAKLSNKSYFGKEKPIEWFNLDINFDKYQSRCEAFSLVFSIITLKDYKEVYNSCGNVEEDNNEDIPNVISVTKTSTWSFSSHIKKQFEKEKKTGNLVKIINIEFDHDATFEAKIKYVHSDNMMGIVMYNSEDYKDFYKVGIEKLEGGHVNGVWVHKTISANVKRGRYKIKLIHHSIFTEEIQNIFKNETEKICHRFTLDISATDLNKSTSEEEVFTSELKNAIIKVSPVSLTNLRIGNKIDITVTFSNDYISDRSQIKSLSNLIYLTENNKKTLGAQIFPSYISDYSENKLTFTYELTPSYFQIGKCYKLNFNQFFSKDITDLIIEKIEHNYCIMKCDCNPASRFTCSVTGKCRCKSPYTGEKCDECEEGFKLTNNKECIDINLLNLSCDEKTTCNGNGYCLIPGSSFDPYSTDKENFPCKCNSGFTSTLGIPMNSFCNSCSNKNDFYPFCQPTEGEDFDKLGFTFSSRCSDFPNAPTLPMKLYSKGLNKEASEDTKFEDIQKSDGSINYSKILKVTNDIEYTDILIPEDSVIRVMFISNSFNTAKVSVAFSRNDNSIISTNGKDYTESFIAKLKKREEPYTIKIQHILLSNNCNRYQIKISIIPINLLWSSLMCSEDNTTGNLPEKNLEVSGDDSFESIKDKWFNIVDDSILTKENFHQKIRFNNSDLNETRYAKRTGKLSNGFLNEPFEYNIKLNVKNYVSFSAIARYKFLTNDIMLYIRNATSGEVMKKSKWMTSETSDDVEDFHSGLQISLQPGEYYLTISANLAVNQLTQIFYQKDINYEHCFKFMLNLQSNLNIREGYDFFTNSTEESTVNRIVGVEPTSKMNTKVAKKLNIYVTFSEALSSQPKVTEFGRASFLTSFYLENASLNGSVYPSHVNLQSSKNTFQVTFEENVLEPNQCYILRYDLSNLQSYVETKKIISDVVEHKYCTKTCDCNPHINFDCDGEKCLCKSPYKGLTCNECVEGYFFVNGRCISQDNCNKNLCSNKGKCMLEKSEIKCLCNTYFKGSDCSECSNNEFIFPDCDRDLLKNIKDVLGRSFKGDDLLTTKASRMENDCEYQFLPYDLDNLGYLHLDGNMHISGKYSIMNLNDKNYQMNFTLKQPSHIKLYLEHNKLNYVITMFLLDRDSKEVLLTSKNIFGPAGLGTASLINFVSSEGKFTVVFYVKDISDSNDVDINSFTYDNIDNDENPVKEECLTVFLEMQTMTLQREGNVIEGLKSSNEDWFSVQKKIELVPSSMTIYDYQSQFYKQLQDGIATSFSYYRNSSETDINYFHHEYIYIPDYIDKQMKVEIEISSKFLNAQIGAMLEIAELPEDIKNEIKIAKMTNDKIRGYLNKTISQPLCAVHCYPGIKKYNSIIISRILPSDSFVRIWLYDVSPSPQLVKYENQYASNSYVPFTAFLKINYYNSNDKALAFNLMSSLCHSNELPTELNTKDYLGDSKYLKRYGFHILDYYRIDRLAKGVHVSSFNVTESTLFRILVHGRVDVDLQLFSVEEQKNKLIARSNGKGVENVIAIELPPGNYKIKFIFYVPNDGYRKCESVLVEFAMQEFTYVYSSIQRMITKYRLSSPNKELPNSFPEIKILEHLQNKNNLFEKDLQTITYPFMLKPSFVIGKDDLKTYSSIITISKLNFAIEAKDNRKLQLNAFAISDFLYVDVFINLVYIPDGSSEQKVISSTHRKNMNVLMTKRLQSGKYQLLVQYYRRLSYPGKDKNASSNLEGASFAEVHFDSQIINVSDDLVTILTDKGYLRIHPLPKKTIPQSYQCRRFGLPIPKSLNNLRYLEFNSDSRIIDSYLVPKSGEGKHIIKFRLNGFTNGMIRVYAESNEVSLGLILSKKLGGKSEIVTKSDPGVHFTTFMEFIDERTEYEITILFKGFVSDDNKEKVCHVFKMEIAVEKNHSYACPDSPKYALLTSMKDIIPKTLPLKKSENNNKSLYRYNSRSYFKGEPHQSGYIYLLRSQNDTYIQFQSFNVIKSIDFKFEVTNDFAQAPVTIILTSSSKSPTFSLSSLISKTLSRISPKSYVIAYSELQESRTSLLIKNLPVGKYVLYFYLPGLKTKFPEKRVCSVYDIVIEAKKSKNHFQAKEIINTSGETALDFTSALPLTLDSPRFMSGYGPYTYINYINNYYMRNASTTSKNELINTIPFKLYNESMVVFDVMQPNILHEVSVSIDQKTDFKNHLSMILPSGNYNLKIKMIEKNKSEKSNFIQEVTTSSPFKFYIGIAPVSRLKTIYNYNNILASEHQCISTRFDKLTYNSKLREYRYDEPLFMYRRSDLVNSTIISRVNVNLTRANVNRFIAEIGTDTILNSVTLNVLSRSERKKYEMKFENNHGFIDLILPRGLYTIELRLLSPLIIEEQDCILMSVNIHISEASKENLQLLPFEYKKKGDLLQKCDGDVIPFEIMENNEVQRGRINQKGSYSLHLPNALYFTQKQKSKFRKNINEITLTVSKDSLLHITTRVDSVNVFNIIPKIKVPAKEVNKTYTKSPRIISLSPSMRTRDTIYQLQANKDNYYTLELGLNNDITSKFPSCPLYSLDILIEDFSQLGNKYNCLKRNNKVITAKKPNQTLGVIVESYTEALNSTYFTEKEYASLLLTGGYNHFEYPIKFTLPKQKNTKYYINVDIGYEHSVSSFGIYLFDEKETLVSQSSMSYNKKTRPFSYHTSLSDNVDSGTYTLIIHEYIWNNMTNLIKGKSASNNYLCLPLSYALSIKAVNEKDSEPLILGVYPAGKVIAVEKGKDVTLKVVLSKSPFTAQREPITSIYNYLSIRSAFFITKKGEKKDYYYDSADKIIPTKVHSHVNNREWEIIFDSQDFNTKDKEFELHFDRYEIFDSERNTFDLACELPILKFEAEDESQVEEENVESIMKTALEDREEYVEQKSDGNINCGSHGKSVYNEIEKKYICTCFDGFKGNNCEICEGEILKGKCIIEEEDEEETDEDDTYVDNSGYQMPTIINDCGGCINGECDTVKGVCRCKNGYTGKHCDILIKRDIPYQQQKFKPTIISPSPSKQTTKVEPNQKSKSQSSVINIISKVLSRILYLGLILIIVFVVLLFIRNFMRKVNATKGYDTLDQNDDNTRGGIASINTEIDAPKLEIDPEPENEDSALVNYEISSYNSK